MERRREHLRQSLESPALFSLLGAVGQGVLIEDAARKIFRVNQHFLDLFGIPAPPEAMVGADCAEAGRAAAQAFVDSEGFLPRVAEILSAREAVRSEELELKDGRVFFRDYVPVIEDDETLGHIWLYRDQTEKRRLQERLQESERTYRQFFTANRAVALLIDPSTGAILHANHAAAQFYGWSATELSSMRIQDINLLSEEEVQEEMQRARDLDRDHFLFRHRTASGRAHDVEVFSGPIDLPSGPALYSIIRPIDQRVLAEERLRASEERFRTAFEDAPIGMVANDEAGRMTNGNAAFAELLGVPARELPGRTLCEFIHEDDRPHWQGKVRMLRAGELRVVQSEKRLVRPGGSEVWVTLVASRLGDDAGPPRTLVMAVDISAEREREQLRSQFLHSQRMEAVGRLAGGVAHDFNNLLTVITNYTDLLIARADAEHAIHEDLDQISSASRRASELTRQLLAFSRKQVIEPRPLDPDEAIDGAQRMIRRLIGEDIQLHVKALGRNAAVSFDPGQFDQVLVNLAVNARDAMPAGGRLHIETSVIPAGSPEAPDSLRANTSLRLEVRDTGIGMDADTASRIFEPFFTTKPMGEGSGLGLATVYGIVRQHGGVIHVDSEPGRGTRFRLHFPILENPSKPVRTAGRRTSLAPQAEGATVLVVEDEPSVRRVAVRILRSAGYLVIEAVDGNDAVERSDDFIGDIDLVLSDVLMPHMNGPRCLELLREKRPDLPALFMSGYTEDRLEKERGELRDDVAFIPKPFSRAALLRKVRGVLEAARTRSSDRPPDEEADASRSGVVARQRTKIG